MKEASYVLCVGMKRFEISEGICQLIELIDGKRTLAEIAHEYSTIRSKTYTTKDVCAIASTFLIPFGILVTTETDDLQRKSSSYFYFHYPIFRKEKVQLISSVLKTLYDPRIVFCFGLFSFVFFFIFNFSLFEFANFNLHHVSFQDTVFTLMIFGFLGVFHEFGHSSACAFCGASPGEIGIGLYLRYPVLYSDVTDAWKLPRKQRALVDFGGIYFQLVLLPVLFVLYLVTLSNVFLYAILLNYGSALLNLNPIFRFDGYWLFSDIAGVPNLRRRSLEILRYFAIRFFIRNKRVVEPVFLRMSGRIKLSLCAYGVISIGFFVLFFYKIIFLLPNLIVSYPSLLYKTFGMILSSITAGDWKEVGSALSGLIFPSLLILMFGFAIHRIGKRLTRMVIRHGLRISKLK